jgi:hypothetical protein
MPENKTPGGGRIGQTYVLLVEAHKDVPVSVVKSSTYLAKNSLRSFGVLDDI